MHHLTDRIAHTTAFVTPVVEHWLEREIAHWEGKRERERERERDRERDTHTDKETEREETHKNEVSCFISNSLNQRGTQQAKQNVSEILSITVNPISKIIVKNILITAQFDGVPVDHILKLRLKFHD